MTQGTSQCEQCRWLWATRWSLTVWYLAPCGRENCRKLAVDDFHLNNLSGLKGQLKQVLRSRSIRFTFQLVCLVIITAIWTNIPSPTVHLCRLNKYNQPAVLTLMTKVKKIFIQYNVFSFQLGTYYIFLAPACQNILRYTLLSLQGEETQCPPQPH